MHQPNAARRKYLQWALGSAAASLGAPAMAQACIDGESTNKLRLNTSLLWNFTPEAYRRHLEIIYPDLLVFSNSVEVAIGLASSKTKTRQAIKLEDGWQTRIRISATLPQKDIFCSNLSLIYSASAEAGPTHEVASFLMSPECEPHIEMSVIAPCYLNHISVFAAVATIRDFARDELVGHWASLPLLVHGCDCGSPSIEYG